MHTTSRLLFHPNQLSRDCKYVSPQFQSRHCKQIQNAGSAKEEERQGENEHAAEPSACSQHFFGLPDVSSEAFGF